MYRDSFDKIVTYFKAVVKEPLEYKGKVYAPLPLLASPLLFRKMNCKLGCAGCCPRFSLDYLPSEGRVDKAEPRTVSLNGQDFELFSYIQKEEKTYHCDFVDMKSGACIAHDFRPFSCDFETVKLMDRSSSSQYWLGNRPFGRAWILLKVDGTRGAICEFFTDITPESRADAIRKLLRLKEWADYFGLRTILPEVITWAETTTEAKWFNSEFLKKDGLF